MGGGPQLGGERPGPGLIRCWDFVEDVPGGARVENCASMDGRALAVALRADEVAALELAHDGVVLATAL